jgi:hypothetical protein
MDRSCSTDVEKRNACRLLVKKSEGKRSLGRPRRKGQIALTWILDGVVWTGLVWLRMETSGGLF